MKNLNIILISFITLFLACGCTTSGSKAFIPTPEHAMSMAMGEDTIKWKMDHMNGSPAGMIAEFVPEGQSIKAWRQMVAQQITFTNETVSEHIESWKTMVKGGDPNVVIVQESVDTSSVTVSYRSEAFNEYSLRRFIKGTDGIYVLAYHVRLNEIDEDRIKLWADIIAKAHLVRNPQKG